MRRCLAPSRQSYAFKEINDPSSDSNKPTNAADPSRNSSSYKDPIIQDRPVSNESKMQNTNTASSLGRPIVYNVVWGKKSTKKHKTWEGDGSLEVHEKSAVLKDTEGQVLGRITNVKPTSIEEGAIISVGSKEVQIIERLDAYPIEKPKALSDAIDPPASKKLKRKASSFLSPGIKKRQTTFQPTYEPLILPDPPTEHQILHNQNNSSVVPVSVDPCLARVLRPHQRVGVTFLYKCTMGYLGENIGYGAILADEMGLGKTLQCITLVWTLLKHGPYGDAPIIRKIIVVTPSSLVGNWQNEFNRWLGKERIQTMIIDAKNKPKDFSKYTYIPVMIISYEMFLRYNEDIKDIKFDMVICDEGHRLKNNTIKISTLLSQLESRRRIILTGTPIQNDIQEFYSLIDFVNPGILGDVGEYRKYFEDPIVASRQPDAEDDVRQLGEERATQLNEITSSFILRRTQEINDKYLPSKQETVISCRLSELQKKLYLTAVDFWENRNEVDFQTGSVQHLSVITALKKICNHPSLISQQNENDDDEENQFLNNSNLVNKLKEILPSWDEMSIEDSCKLTVVDAILKSLTKTNEKIVLISYFTKTLDMLAGLCDHKNYKYCRLDGSTPTNQRTRTVEQFNSSYSDTFVFLLSAKAGGVGLNLIGASRLVMYDNDWNPATDLQAMSRIWRDGQKKSVYIYRLLTTGTIEEKIYQRQISKIGLSGSIVDPQNKNNIKLSNEELKDLFTLHYDTDSVTHKMIDCKCKCDGTNVNEKNKPTELTDSEVVDTNVVKQNLRMNQLECWEHHGPPFNNVSLTEMALSEAVEFISFMFINKCSTK